MAACKRRGIRVLSVAGAGAKADPTRLHVVDVWESSCDSLAKALRYRWAVAAGCAAVAGRAGHMDSPAQARPSGGHHAPACQTAMAPPGS